MTAWDPKYTQRYDFDAMVMQQNNQAHNLYDLAQEAAKAQTRKDIDRLRNPIPGFTNALDVCHAALAGVPPEVVEVVYEFLSKFIVLLVDVKDTGFQPWHDEPESARDVKTQVNVLLGVACQFWNICFDLARKDWGAAKNPAIAAFWWSQNNSLLNGFINHLEIQSISRCRGWTVDTDNSLCILAAKVFNQVERLRSKFLVYLERLERDGVIPRSVRFEATKPVLGEPMDLTESQAEAFEVTLSRREMQFRSGA